MNVIILEDEHAAKINLISILKKVNEEINIVAVLDSVKTATDWLLNNDHPDLGFFDIQLADEIVFNLFTKIDIQFPVIFTTAYDEYAIRAFKVQSIDYILKPINEESIAFSINKYKSLNSTHNSFFENNIQNLINQINSYNKDQHNESLLVHYKNKLIPVKIRDIVCFYIEHGIVYILTKSNKSFSLDKTLDTIEQYLDPNEFKRANRQSIVSRSSIVEIEYYFNQRYIIKTNPPSPGKIIVSKGRSNEFIRWIGI